MQGIDYKFNDKQLLDRAFSHPSLSEKESNQRLEFLGDTVLALIVAEMLYVRFPDEAEGALARRHAALVCGETLSRVAQEMGLGAHIRMSASEAAGGGRETPSNLEDAIEALIGAIYLDGGLEAAKPFVQAKWEKLLDSHIDPPKDAKTALQEWAQGRGLPVPVYTETSRSGPAHEPVFTVEVYVEGKPLAKGTARAKRAAEQLAAAALLKTLGA